MKIGRNDPCPCGSGKKYKHCCLLKESMSTGDLIRAAVQNAGYKEDIANVLCNLSEYMKRKQWWGACHASCSVHQIKEKGIIQRILLDLPEFFEFIKDNKGLPLAEHISNNFKDIISFMSL